MSSNLEKGYIFGDCLGTGLRIVGSVIYFPSVYVYMWKRGLEIE